MFHMFKDAPLSTLTIDVGEILKHDYVPTRSGHFSARSRSEFAKALYDHFCSPARRLIGTSAISEDQGAIVLRIIYTKELTSDEIAGRFFAFNGKAQTWDESIQSLSLESLANVLISAKAAAPGRASSKSGADFCRLPTPRWESGGRRGPSSSGNSRCNRCRG